MIWIVGSVVYGVCAAAVARMLAGHFAWVMFKNQDDRYKGGRQEPGGGQWAGAIMGACLLAFIWPVVMCFMAPWPSVGEEARAESRKKTARIRELEKELHL